VRLGQDRRQLVVLARQVDDRDRLAVAHHAAVRAEQHHLAGVDGGRQRGELAVAGAQHDRDASAARDVGRCARIARLGEPRQAARQLRRLLGGGERQDRAETQLGEELEVDRQRVARHAEHLRIHCDDREALRPLGSI